MTVAELLEQEKGKYSLHELHYQKFGKYAPFAFTTNRKFEDMKVVEYRFKEIPGMLFDLKMNYLGVKKDNTLIIVWEKI